MNIKALTTTGLSCCLIGFALIGFKPKSIQKPYTEETFSFKTQNDSIALTGTLSIPDNFNDKSKAVILVPPPHPADEDYNGFYSVLANKLAQQNIAVLGYNNRAFTDSIYAKSKNYTFLNQVTDIQNAFYALKQDKRFKNIKIGLLGHSQAGTSAAILAHKSKDVDFVVNMSSPGISGVTNNYDNTVQLINAFFKKYTENEKEIALHVRKQYLEIIDTTAQVNLISDFLYKNAIENFYLYAEAYPKIFGENPPKKEYLKTPSPEEIAIVKFKPSVIYSKIICPTLITFGEMDEILNAPKNTNGFKHIFDSVHKTNYKIITFDSLNHSYEIFKETDLIPKNTIRYHGKEKPKLQIQTAVFDSVAHWINTL
ncbi:MAG: alpha/beta hydrolase family protein [Flavobacteriaceae bacterium]